MIFVDSSVWIDYFNGKVTAQTDWLDHILGVQLVATGELILTEVLQGFKQDEHYEQSKQLLLSLDQIPMLTTAIALQSAENFRGLRKQGITIRKTIDVLIATFCISQQLPLLHADKDFEPFHQHYGLKRALPSH